MVSNVVRYVTYIFLVAKEIRNDFSWHDASPCAANYQAVLCLTPSPPPVVPLPLLSVLMFAFVLISSPTDSQ